MPFVHYDKAITHRTNVKGIYTTTPPAGLEPIVEVDQRSIELFKRNPNAYLVKDDRLVRIEETNGNFKKEQAVRQGKNQTKLDILSPLEFDSHVYNVDSAFYDNIALCLGIVALDKEHVCKLWAKNVSTDEWIFLDHDKVKLLELAKALNTRRQDSSEKLYR